MSDLFNNDLKKLEDERKKLVAEGMMKHSARITELDRKIDQIKQSSRDSFVSSANQAVAEANAKKPENQKTEDLVKRYQFILQQIDKKIADIKPINDMISDYGSESVLSQEQIDRLKVFRQEYASLTKEAKDIWGVLGVRKARGEKGIPNSSIADIYIRDPTDLSYHRGDNTNNTSDTNSTNDNNNNNNNNNNQSPPQQTGDGYRARVWDDVSDAGLTSRDITYRQTGAAGRSASLDQSGLDQASVPKTDAAQRTEYFQRMAERLQAQRDQHASTMNFIPGMGMVGRAAEIYQMTPNIEMHDKMEQAQQLALQGKKEGYQQLDRIVKADEILNTVVQNGALATNDLQKLREVSNEELRLAFNMGTVDVENMLKEINSGSVYQRALAEASVALDIDQERIVLMLAAAAASNGDRLTIATTASVLGVNLEAPFLTGVNQFMSDFVGRTGGTYQTIQNTVRNVQDSHRRFAVHTPLTLGRR